MPIIDVHVGLFDWDDQTRLHNDKCINYRLYNRDTDETYDNEISISPQEAILIGTKLIEAAIPMLAEEDWDDLKRKAK